MIATSVCNLCQQAGATWYCRKDSIDVLRCPCCGLIYTAETRGYEDLVGHYSEEYFEPYLKTKAIHQRQRFGKRIKEIKQYAFPGTLLDVGCGAGFFLKLASETGYAAEGIELSPYAVQYARQKLGLRVSQGELGEAHFSDESFDIITLWHIIEHVRDPRTFLCQAHKLLRNNGLLAVEVPNIGSPLARIAGEHWELMAPLEHFYYFNISTIKRYLTECGFTVLRMQTFYWTTPAMILRAYACKHKLLPNLLLRSSAKMASCLSFMRFQTAPPIVQGDALTVYAVKNEGIA
jgi:2-polyprenyl-3-methyl-5-hydroxy-6-metoxy-1,4-benzoquinol methylase